MKKYLFFFLIGFISCKKDSFEINTNIQKTTQNISYEFSGYKVNVTDLTISKLKNNGREYWKNTQILPDLIVRKFQKPYGDKSNYGTFYYGITAGDFNKDGYIDVFNGGVLYNGIKALPKFLIWDSQTKIFEEQNLFNQQIENLGNPTKVVSLYINDDDYVDLVCFSYIDEGLSNPKLYKLVELLSDGKGKYDVVELTTETPIFYHNGGDVGDLNGDKFPDLVVNCGGLMSILWGIKSFPYFNESNPAIFSIPIVNLNSTTFYSYHNNNGFYESVPEIVDRYVWNSSIVDVNKDGWNDLIFSSVEDTSSNSHNYNKIILNLGNGRFNKNSIINLPFNNNKSNNMDYIVDDINGDNLNDIITSVDLGNQDWKFYIYYQNKNGSFTLDKNSFITSKLTINYKDYKPHIIYFDFNGDGQKDITYIDGADNGQQINKTVFIRKGNQFIEEDFYQYDVYAKTSLKN